jgi:hypothetical protein
MSVLIPVSVGELFDKITILQIKLQKITDISKLNNIKKEYDFLVEIATKIDADFLSNSHYQKLFEINSELWVVEDSKRNHEANKDFGDSFIFWARKVYMKNDERAAVKRKINELYGSEIVEEKSYKYY